MNNSNNNYNKANDDDDDDDDVRCLRTVNTSTVISTDGIPWTVGSLGKYGFDRSDKLLGTWGGNTFGEIDELKFPGTATHTDTYTYDVVVVDRVDSTIGEGRWRLGQVRRVLQYCLLTFITRFIDGLKSIAKPCSPNRYKPMMITKYSTYKCILFQY